ncbi:uncharacterized protein LOC132446171 [Gadus macrocephalus]|uniref:uncharacterized protein LOC132446171 n=1 Tax=Gadus macrocephalus TaxID=80720 RepID=UPI0028CB36E9|nr:uncharacterized protein LOC132446171 [Gadus macrocephalus]
MHFNSLQIEKCPMMLRGQTSILRVAQTCSCGFHPRQSVSSPAASRPATSASTSAASASTSAAPVQSPGRPALTLSMFDKARFGRTLSAAARPNVNVTRKHVERPPSPATTPAGRSTPSATPPPATPPSSPRYIRPVSPFSLPPSSPVMSSVRTGSSPLVASDRSLAPPGPVPAPPGPVPAPPGPVPAPPAPLPAPPGPVPTPPCTSSFLGPAPQQFWLPAEMKKTIPQQDQRWIASTLWRNQRLRPDLQLWYEPPVPGLIYNQVPSPDRFFTHRLLVWMPYHLWKVRLSCPKCGKQLTGAGMHKRARQVLDVDRYYLMVTETLRCNALGCVTNYLSTSQTVLDQLSLPLRGEFRLILTRKYACDIRVIRMLRERTLGNSSTLLAKQLRENHGEEWLQRVARYLEVCADFVDQPSLFPVVCQEPPEPVAVPTNRWLLTVYGKDLMSRMDHIKASIT